MDCEEIIPRLSHWGSGTNRQAKKQSASGERRITDKLRLKLGYESKYYKSICAAPLDQEHIHHTDRSATHRKRGNRPCVLVFAPRVRRRDLARPFRSPCCSHRIILPCN